MNVLPLTPSKNEEQELFSNSSNNDNANWVKPDKSLKSSPKSSISSLKAATFQAEGINCAGCVRLLLEHFEHYIGVSQINVNIIFGHIWILYDPKTITVDDIVIELEELGFLNPRHLPHLDTYQEGLLDKDLSHETPSDHFGNFCPLPLIDSPTVQYGECVYECENLTAQTNTNVDINYLDLIVLTSSCFTKPSIPEMSQFLFHQKKAIQCLISINGVKRIIVFEEYLRVCYDSMAVGARTILTHLHKKKCRTRHSQSVHLIPPWEQQRELALHSSFNTYVDSLSSSLVNLHQKLGIAGCCFLISLIIDMFPLLSRTSLKTTKFHDIQRQLVLLSLGFIGLSVAGNKYRQQCFAWIAKCRCTNNTSSSSLLHAVLLSSLKDFLWLILVILLTITALGICVVWLRQILWSGSEYHYLSSVLLNPPCCATLVLFILSIFIISDIVDVRLHKDALTAYNLTLANNKSLMVSENLHNDYPMISKTSKHNEWYRLLLQRQALGVKDAEDLHKAFISMPYIPLTQWIHQTILPENKNQHTSSTTFKEKQNSIIGIDVHEQLLQKGDIIIVLKNQIVPVDGIRLEDTEFSKQLSYNDRKPISIISNPLLAQGGIFGYVTVVNPGDVVFAGSLNLGEPIILKIINLQQQSASMQFLKLIEVALKRRKLIDASISTSSVFQRHPSLYYSIFIILIIFSIWFLFIVPFHLISLSFVIRNNKIVSFDKTEEIAPTKILKLPYSIIVVEIFLLFLSTIMNATLCLFGTTLGLSSPLSYATAYVNLSKRFIRMRYPQRILELISVSNRVILERTGAFSRGAVELCAACLIPKAFAKAEVLDIFGSKFYEAWSQNQHKFLRSQSPLIQNNNESHSPLQFSPYEESLRLRNNKDSTSMTLLESKLSMYQRCISSNNSRDFNDTQKIPSKNKKFLLPHYQALSSLGHNVLKKQRVPPSSFSSFFSSNTTCDPSSFLLEPLMKQENEQENNSSFSDPFPSRQIDNSTDKSNYAYYGTTSSGIGMMSNPSQYDDTQKQQKSTFINNNDDDDEGEDTRIKKKILAMNNHNYKDSNEHYNKFKHPYEKTAYFEDNNEDHNMNELKSSIPWYSIDSIFLSHPEGIPVDTFNRRVYSQFNENHTYNKNNDNNVMLSGLHQKDQSTNYYSSTKGLGAHMKFRPSIVPRERKKGHFDILNKQKKHYSANKENTPSCYALVPTTWIQSPTQLDTFINLTLPVQVPSLPPPSHVTPTSVRIQTPPSNHGGSSSSFTLYPTRSLSPIAVTYNELQCGFWWLIWSVYSLHPNAIITALTKSLSPFLPRPVIPIDNYSVALDGELDFDFSDFQVGLSVLPSISRPTKSIVDQKKIHGRRDSTTLFVDEDLDTAAAADDDDDDRSSLFRCSSLKQLYYPPKEGLSDFPGDRYWLTRSTTDALENLSYLEPSKRHHNAMTSPLSDQEEKRTVHRLSSITKESQEAIQKLYESRIQHNETEIETLHKNISHDIHNEDGKTLYYKTTDDETFASTKNALNKFDNVQETDKPPPTELKFRNKIKHLTILDILEARQSLGLGGTKSSEASPLKDVLTRMNITAKQLSDAQCTCRIPCRCKAGHNPTTGLAVGSGPMRLAVAVNTPYFSALQKWCRSYMLSGHLAVCLHINNICVGCAAFKDLLRPRATEFVVLLKRLYPNRQIWLCTNEEFMNAQATAETMDISIENVVCRATPKDKFDLVLRLSQDNKENTNQFYKSSIVCMIGSGISDTLAYLASDIGIHVLAETFLTDEIRSSQYYQCYPFNTTLMYADILICRKDPDLKDIEVLFLIASKLDNTLIQNAMLSMWVHTIIWLIGSIIYFINNNASSFNLSSDFFIPNSTTETFKFLIASLLTLIFFLISNVALQ